MTPPHPCALGHATFGYFTGPNENTIVVCVLLKDSADVIPMVEFHHKQFGAGRFGNLPTINNIFVLMNSDQSDG